MQHFAPEVIVPARSTGSADTRPEPRHARLFELIRQQSLSGVLSVHIDNQCQAETSEVDASAFLEGAGKSLEHPAQAA